jgi:hypothetical protein
VGAETYQAAFDVLSITRRLEQALDGVTRAEIHLLAYVACLLAMFRRVPAAEWGYGFIRSQWGAPFSAEIEGALVMLAEGGLVRIRRETLAMTTAGEEMLGFLDGTVEHGWRIQYLEGACDSALAMSAGVIRDALRQEPGLRRASVHHEPRNLLGAGEDAALYEQFGILSSVVSVEVSDLMVPSVLWLSYLKEIQRLEIERRSNEVGLNEAPNQSE